MIFSDDLTLKWGGFLWKNRVDKKKVEWCYNIGDQLHGVISHLYGLISMQTYTIK